MAVARFRITERQVLLFIMAASILAYIGAIFVVTFRQKGQQPDLSRPARVRWMNPQAAAQRSPDMRYIIADFLDPSLMSLPNAHGFSRRTWEGQPTAKYLPPEPPVELAFLDAGASAAMESLLDELSVPEAVRASVEKLAIQPDRPSEPQPVETSAPNMTVVVFTAGLEQRRLTARPELPTITSERSLSPTRARLAVAPDGVVRYVMLERSCGSTPVDEQALEIVRHLRFEPAGGTSALTLTWGVAKFVWATAPLTENHN
jgi:TonB family protein